MGSGCGSASYLHKAEKILAGLCLGCMELSLLSKAASFDCLDDIRPRNLVEIDSLGHKDRTELNLEAVILRGPADSGRMVTGIATGKSEFVVMGMQNPAEAGNSLVEHLDLRTGPGHVEHIHRADSPGLEDRWLPQACLYEVFATLCIGHHRDR